METPRAPSVSGYPDSDKAGQIKVKRSAPGPLRGRAVTVQKVLTASLSHNPNPTPVSGFQRGFDVGAKGLVRGPRPRPVINKSCRSSDNICSTVSVSSVGSRPSPSCRSSSAADSPQSPRWITRHTHRFWTPASRWQSNLANNAVTGHLPQTITPDRGWPWSKTGRPGPERDRRRGSSSRT